MLLVRPQPVVTHFSPEGSVSVAEARQTGDTRAFSWAGEDSFSRVMSLFMFLASQEGWVMAWKTAFKKE